MNAPPDPTISLVISYLIDLYGSIVTRAFDPSHPMTMFLTNCNLTLFQSDSHITCMLKSSMSEWIVKVTLFLGLWINFLSEFILENIFDQTYLLQMDFPNYIICIIWEFSCWRRPVETLLADICESKIPTESSGKGIRSNVYSLGVIIWSAFFPKQLQFFPAFRSFPIGNQVNGGSVMVVWFLLRTTYWETYSGR